ncbi:hypothetical protein [Mycolicibacterium llatzerense]|uniref:hypothetical protein n=1 Tax=Mycolicibacterium llatzerense TaxID=280871 RepID=UPI0021B5591D|nr:hypothetical protein [Mycolicibacterium llatzerense]
MADNDIERKHVEEAIDRLIAGTPLHTTGHHTVVALAKESGVQRTRLYEQYPDLIADFKQRAQQAISPRLIIATSDELTQAHQRAKELIAENTQLRQRIRTLSAVIAELSIERDQNNVVRLRT